MTKKLFVHSFGKGPNLILLHGWGLHSGIWQALAPKLALYFRVFLVDLPGFGLSDIPDGSYQLNTVTAQILAESPEVAIWLGWSLGGLVAMNAAALAPHRVERLITVGSSPKFIQDQASHWPGITAMALDKFAESLIQNYQATFMRFLTLQFYGMPVDTNLLQRLSDTFRYHQPQKQILVDSLAILHNSDCRSVLQNIHCPSLAVFGKLDMIVPVAVATAVAQLNSAIQTEIFSQASHAPFISHQQEFIDTVIQFCFS